jgi:hypothetical protein
MGETEGKKEGGRDMDKGRETETKIKHHKTPSKINIFTKTALKKTLYAHVCTYQNSIMICVESSLVTAILHFCVPALDIPSHDVIIILKPNHAYRERGRGWGGGKEGGRKGGREVGGERERREWW